MFHFVHTLLLIGIFDANDVNDLVKESLQMRSFSHSNVMGLLGICLNAGPAPYIVLPFMSGGSLLAHLKTNREEFVIKSDEYKEQVHTALITYIGQWWLYLFAGRDTVVVNVPTNSQRNGVSCCSKVYS